MSYTCTTRKVEKFVIIGVLYKDFSTITIEDFKIWNTVICHHLQNHFCKNGVYVKKNSSINIAEALYNLNQKK